MDYKEFQEEIIGLQKERIEYIKAEKKKGSYFTLFQISIDIVGRLFQLGKQIKSLKKT